MPGPSKVIVFDPDTRAGQQVQLGFEREGVATVLAPIPPVASPLELPADDAGLVIVGGPHGDDALELLRRVRAAVDARAVDAPIVFTGGGVRRSDAEAAGAHEVVLRPAFLRDLVTIGRLLRGHPARRRHKLVGSLAETTGVYPLVRALAALGRSAVLTLMRGLRRGEIRYFHGEVTSAQVGVIHGQAAFHQLLLWTEARFELHHEDVVRRQQIPMSHDELFADADRFLEGVRDASGGLSPSMLLEQDGARIRAVGLQIPTEVHEVLRLFDGHRVLADVLEDSPYRVFETLRVTQRAVDVGLLRPIDARRPRATWRAVLSIEEWLVGSDREGALARPPPTETGPVPLTSASPPEKPPSGSRRRRKKRRASTPAPVRPPGKQLPSTKPEIDWGALVPRVVGADARPLSGVVPAAHTSGEIEVPTRDAPRERLEALMDTAKRERIFPIDIGLEPTVVLDDRPAPARRVRGDAEASRGGDQPLAPAPSAPAPAREADAAARPEPDVASSDTASSDTASSDITATRERESTAAELVKDLVAVERRSAVPPVPQADAVASPAPETTEDEPSDGIVRDVAPADPAPPPKRPPPDEAPPDDRPGAATGEISRTHSGPTVEPRLSEPSILVEDLGDAHAAVAAVATAQAAAPASPDVASASHERAVAEVREDARAAFTEVEEEFFRSGVDRPTRPPAIAVERFDDLDEGYQPVRFWDRLRGKQPKDG